MSYCQLTCPLCAYPLAGELDTDNSDNTTTTTTTTKTDKNNKRSLNSKVERYYKRLRVSTETLLKASLYGIQQPHSTKQTLPICEEEVRAVLHNISQGASPTDIVIYLENLAVLEIETQPAQQ